MIHIRAIYAAALVSCCLATATPVPAQRSECSGTQPAHLQLVSRTLPIRKIGGAVLFAAGMYVDADGAPNAYAPHDKGLDFTANAKNGGNFVSLVLHADGHPVVQRSGRYKGFYVSTTSLRKRSGRAADPATYVNAAKIPYIVLPPEFMHSFAVALGDLAVVTNRQNGKSSFAIFADVGPRGQIGEGSIALARALGLNDDPRRGGTGSPVIEYLVFPGSGLGQGRLITGREVRVSGSKLLRQWGGAKRLRACSMIN
jgi:glycosyl hydrolase group 75 (putative chitosanase)